MKMRPNKFRTEMYKAIQYKRRTGSGEKFTPYLMKRAKRAHNAMRKDPNMEGAQFDNCFYYEADSETIDIQLMYISDRFMAPHRLGWLIEGVECGRLLGYGYEKN